MMTVPRDSNERVITETDYLLSSMRDYARSEFRGIHLFSL